MLKLKRTLNDMCTSLPKYLNLPDGMDPRAVESMYGVLESGLH